jgi:hypothetical protein
MRNLITSSALAAGAIVAAAVFSPSVVLAQSAPICLQTESGGLDCAYHSVSQCLSARTGMTDTCGINPEYGGTVGFGSASPRLAEPQEPQEPLLSPQPEPYPTR